MGQYYKAVKLNDEGNLKDLEYIQPRCIKLTEHSYLGDESVGQVMRLMSPGNRWHKSQVVWCGDYYGDEDGEIDYYEVADEGKEIRSGKFIAGRAAAIFPYQSY